MYIVFVSTELDPIVPGGAGAVIAQVGRRLAAGGHRVEVLVNGKALATEAFDLMISA